MTIWLAVYLGIGVIVLGTMLPAYLRERPSKWARQMMEEIQPQRRSIRNRLLGDFVAPALAAVFVVVVWPVALVFIIRDHLKRRAQQSDDDDMNDNELEDPVWSASTILTPVKLIVVDHPSIRDGKLRWSTWDSDCLQRRSSRGRESMIRSGL
jgi:hypothetical protein